MSDLIYRDDAIEVVSNAILKGENEIDVLIDLPAAENPKATERIIQSGESVLLCSNCVDRPSCNMSDDGNGKACILYRPKKSDRKRIYIAGPVTGVEGYEETFAKAADVLRAKDYEPVNPVAPGLVEGYSYRDYINRGFQMLMECDGILLLPGYMDSKGAALELHYALAVGMEIIKG